MTFWSSPMTSGVSFLRGRFASGGLVVRSTRIRLIRPPLYAVDERRDILLINVMFVNNKIKNALFAHLLFFLNLLDFFVRHVFATSFTMFLQF